MLKKDLMPTDSPEDQRKITKVSQILERKDGSEVKIVAQTFFGTGLHESTDVYVLQRESKEHAWKLCSEKPHPEWLTMSVDDYVKRGRSEMLTAASIGEILKVTSMVGKAAPPEKPRGPRP